MPFLCLYGKQRVLLNIYDGNTEKVLCHFQTSNKGKPNTTTVSQVATHCF